LLHGWMDVQEGEKTGAPALPCPLSLRLVGYVAYKVQTARS
jgi:hypothetical protein